MLLQDYFPHDHRWRDNGKCCALAAYKAWFTQAGLTEPQSIIWEWRCEITINGVSAELPLGDLNKAMTAKEFIEATIR